MNYEESKEIDKAVQAAFHEVFNEDLDEDTQYKAADRFYDLIDAVVFSDGENEIDFEAGYDLYTKFKDIERDAVRAGLLKLPLALRRAGANVGPLPKIYKAKYDEQTFYFIGTEDEIVKKLNTIFDCWCSNETLMRSGCECGGN